MDRDVLMGPEGTAMDQDGLAGPTRRGLLAVAGAATVALLGACTTYGQSQDDGAGGGDGGDGSQDGAAGGATAIASTGDVPVGGGTVLEDRRVVLTQPVAGTFKCFTAVCTHQGCLVASVANGKIQCPCHGSQYNAADGSVVAGPASRPLRAIGIVVDGTTIKLA